MFYLEGSYCAVKDFYLTVSVDGVNHDAVWFACILLDVEALEFFVILV